MTMLGLSIKIEDGEIEQFIRKEGLENDVNVLQDVVLLPGNMRDGRPAVLLVGTIDGKKRAFKTSLRLILNATQAMAARTEQELGPGWRGP